jgi:hypothetical protein
MARDLLLSLQVPHWLIIVGAALVVVGLIGLAINPRRRADTQSEPSTAPNPEPRPQLPTLPDLLTARPRKDRRET